MTSRERVLAALNHKIPDLVPYMHGFIDTGLQEEIVGHELADYGFDLRIDPGIIAKPGDEIEYTLNYCVHPETARKLNLDALGIRFPIPLFCVARYGRGGNAVERGLLNTHEALRAVKMPDPDDERIYREAEKFLREHRGEYACFAAIRLGASSTLLSMGYDNFSYALYDDIQLAYDVVQMYADWTSALVKNLGELDFDFMWAFDDIASNSGPMFAAKYWDDVFMPRLKKVADAIKCPWIYHSDGNLLPIIDHMLPLGMSGVHPLEPGVMDLDLFKRVYGKRLCMVGNIDIDYTLSKGTVEDVHREVEERIDQLAPGGGYIVSDSNSIPYFCKAENVIALSEAVARYRDFYGGAASA